MSDNNKPKKKATDDYMSGLGSADNYLKTPPAGKIQKATNFSISDKQEAPKEVKAEVKPAPVAPKIIDKKPEPPKVVIPKFIKKDSELEKEIVKIIQEVPKEELERILHPTKAAKDRLVGMDFQSRDDMSDEEKRDFIEQISKREPEPEVAQMNGALVWKWQKNRKVEKK